MTPSERSMPVIEARARGAEWIVHLPGGRFIVRPSEAAVRRLVAAEAPGSAIAFLPALGALRAEVDRAAPPSGARPSRGVRPERAPLEASGGASSLDAGGRDSPLAVIPPAPHRTSARVPWSGGPHSDTPESGPGQKALGVAPARSAGAPGVTDVARGVQPDGDPAGSGRAIAGSPATPGRTPSSSDPASPRALDGDSSAADPGLERRSHPAADPGQRGTGQLPLLSG